MTAESELAAQLGSVARMLVERAKSYERDAHALRRVLPPPDEGEMLAFAYKITGRELRAVAQAIRAGGAR